MPYSVDLRERVMDAIDNGERPTDVAKKFKVGLRTIYDWKDLRKETNSLEPKSGYQKGHSHRILDWVQFKEFAQQHPHLKAEAMCTEWTKLSGRSISVSVMQIALQKIKFTYKKKLFPTKNEAKKSADSF
jgi:transposase